MSSYMDHQAFMGLTLGKSTDYRDTYDTSLLQDIPHSLSRDPLGLKADNLSLRGTDIWTLCELPRLNVEGLPRVAVGHVELNYTSVNLIELKSFKLYPSNFNQTRLNNWDGVRQTLEHDLSTYAQDKVNMALYCLDELGGQPIGHFNSTRIDNWDIIINNYEFIANYLENVTSDERVVEETLVSHLLKSSYLITHQPDWGPIQIRYRGRQIDREKLLHYLVSFHHHSEFHEQCVERIFNNLLRFCQPERLSAYARYTRRGDLGINSRHSSSNSAPSTTRLVRQ